MQPYVGGKHLLLAQGVVDTTAAVIDGLMTVFNLLFSILSKRNFAVDGGHTKGNTWVSYMVNSALLVIFF